MTPTQIIGIDCATDHKKVGVALAVPYKESFQLVAALACSSATLPLQLVTDWIATSPAATLLALDAPLGWPQEMGSSLVSHKAGQPLHIDANRLFRRETDREIAKRFGKTPLDVGADRIARTAHWALGFLGDLRAALHTDIPLAWTSRFEARVAAIEVYPAATLLGHGMTIRGYKASDTNAARDAIETLLRARLQIADDADVSAWPTDALDAAICALAGSDFLDGRTMPPTEMATAASEGWIWAAGPDSELAS